MYCPRNVTFLLHRRTKADPERFSIRMRVKIYGEPSFDVPTPHRIAAEHWDAENCRALPNAPDAASINLTIAEWQGYLGEIFARFEFVEKRKPTASEVRGLFNAKAGRKKPDKPAAPVGDLFPVFDRFTRESGTKNQWTDSTHFKFRALRAHLRAYDAGLSLSTIDDAALQGYVAYLNRQGMRNTTIAKHLAFIRWFLHWAALQGLYAGNLHDTFKPKLKGVGDYTKEIIYLTKAELKQLETAPLPAEKAYLSRVRDVFLFCCFTGLRYSDAAKLRRSDVKDGYIDVVTQKTRDALRIELNRHSQAILDKYRGEPFRGGQALPVISNTKMNLYLKELGKAVGLDAPTRVVFFIGNRRIEEERPKYELLTTHVGRRTFVVMALLLGIPSEVIMKWTGHSSFSAMKPYIAIVDELKSKSMSKFDDIY